jgi:uncharacterized alpha/beta hydrolase family protein
VRKNKAKEIKLITGDLDEKTFTDSSIIAAGWASIGHSGF